MDNLLFSILVYLPIESFDKVKSFDEFSYQLLADRLKKYDFPTLFGFPNGHIFDNKPLIIGANITLKIADQVQVKF